MQSVTSTGREAHNHPDWPAHPWPHGSHCWRGNPKPRRMLAFSVLLLPPGWSDRRKRKTSGLDPSRRKTEDSLRPRLL